MEIYIQKLGSSIYAPIARNNKMWILFRNVDPICNDANLNIIWLSPYSRYLVTFLVVKIIYQ